MVILESESTTTTSTNYDPIGYGPQIGITIIQTYRDEFIYFEIENESVKGWVVPLVMGVVKRVAIDRKVVAIRNNLPMKYRIRIVVSDDDEHG